MSTHSNGQENHRLEKWLAVLCLTFTGLITLVFIIACTDGALATASSIGFAIIWLALIVREEVSPAF